MFGAEVDEFAVYLAGFIDWVLVHVEKLITSFSILCLVADDGSDGL